ncbi:DUF2817 domain-containing protein, partial [Methylogaea oryzae]|uniref:DUF2817 domain-containing protein n=1 Tax=Methylogaea oryzae TaxID=1295382 RepID=UPI0020D1DAD7
LARLECDGHHFPLLAFRFGPSDPTAPVLALFGGVHGLERIGTRVVTSYLQTVLSLARWDRSTQRLLEETRLLVVPLVNPVGMYWQRRSNGNFVDIMRNAPVEAEGVAGWQIFGGHRLSPRLPGTGARKARRWKRRRKRFATSCDGRFSRPKWRSASTCIRDTAKWTACGFPTPRPKPRSPPCRKRWR